MNLISMNLKYVQLEKKSRKKTRIGEKHTTSEIPAATSGRFDDMNTTQGRIISKLLP